MRDGRRESGDGARRNTLPTAGSHLPRHVAVIMDGNGRWAHQRGKPRTAGHLAGARTVRTIVEHSRRIGIPCLTLRDTTERPITISQGSNRLVQPERLAEMIGRVMAGDWPTGRKPELWDGRTAGRIAADLRRRTPPG